MRKRKYLIGALLGVLGAFVLAGTAFATVTSETMSSTATPKKQDVKVRGGITESFLIDRTYTSNTDVTPSPTKNVITFSNDFKFTPGNIPDCNLVSITGKDTAGARAACGGSIVGQGNATQQTASGAQLQGTVTAFNGAPSGGNATLYVHVDFGPAVPTKPILTGTFTGNTLTVNVPTVPGTTLTHFLTVINKRKSGKKSFYLGARCGKKKKWSVTNTTTFTDGSTKTESASQRCKQK
jgi:hypothetical protein